MAHKQVIDVPSTPHFQFLAGRYANENWSVPYFSTAMTFSEAARSLHLTSEIPGSEEINWTIDELYQRDIDWSRVNGRIVPYLRAKEKPQFFNSLTIALLPYSPDEGAIRDNFAEADWTPPPLTEPSRFQKTMSVGPIQLGYWNDWSDLHDPGAMAGEIRWNTNQLFGVAIDGQHRLAALKELVGGNEGAPRFAKSRIPVILLVFAEDVGFVAPQHETQVRLLRRLFIDLNKNAKTVSRARQILLDDSDPHAACVRRLISPELSSSLKELDDVPPRLPLSLVDWHTEQAKFDTGPHLTTVLGLDWLVSKILGAPVGDLMAYGKLNKQLGRIARTLEIDLDEAKDRLSAASTSQLTPFSYSGDDIKSISKGFSEVWSGAICHVLTKFDPYASMIDQRSGNGSLHLDFQSWYELHSSEADSGYASNELSALLSRLSSREEDPISQPVLQGRLNAIDELKAGSLAFNVAFQRALFEAFIEFSKIAQKDVEELEPDDEDEEFGIDDDESDSDDYVVDDSDHRADPVDQSADAGQEQENESVVGDALAKQLAQSHKNIERAKQFVAALNHLVRKWPEFLSVTALHTTIGDETEEQFWLGTLAKPEGGIDFTQGASTRAKDLLFVVAAMWLFDQTTEPDQRSDFENFWNMCEWEEGSLCQRTNRAINRFCTPDTGAAARIINAKEWEFHEDLPRELMQDRMNHLWTIMEL